MALSNSILVAFASRHGSTAELARAIGDGLATHGFEVEVCPMTDVDTVYPYGAYVLGSAVYMGGWLPAARAFLVWHSELIAERPTWLFSSGPVSGLGTTEADDALGRALLAETHARDHRLFGGKLDHAGLNRRERFVGRLVGARDGDSRDWDSAVAWAAEIGGSLTADVRA